MSFNPQLYITAFLTLMFSAPILVGIVTPLLSRIIREQEKEIYDKFKDLQQKAEELAKKRGENEFRKAQEELRIETRAYETFKERTRYIDYSIYLSIFIVFVCGLATWDLFDPSYNTGRYEVIFLFVFSLFLIETLFLFVPILRHVQRSRRTAIKELKNSV